MTLWQVVVTLLLRIITALMATPSQPPEQPTPKQEAANENTSQGRLRELAKASVELVRLVATNPNADPELLRKLGSSSDQTTREGVASNPNIKSA